MKLTEAEVYADVRRRFFSPGANVAPYTLGVELEFIPLNISNRTRIRADIADSPTIRGLRQLATKNHWTEQSYAPDPPAWTLPDGSRISFEPGGQIEVSSAPHPNACELITKLTAICESLSVAMATDGVELLTSGVDPHNGIDAVPVQLRRERYEGMTRYFDALGPSGMQMMRQTAALQINVERGADPTGRWRLLNALSPFVIALFANSRNYAGRDTGWASYRSYFWRTLDPSRTGVVGVDGDPATSYVDFALDAFAMRSATTGTYRSFREWMAIEPLTYDDWQFHLTTLFPEVRAREHFELRSADTIDIADLPAPIVFVSGLVYDDESAERASKILPRPSLELLERAGHHGISDPQIHRLATQLASLGLAGATRIEHRYFSDDQIEIARNYFERKLNLD